MLVDLAADGDADAAAELEAIPQAPAMDERWTWLWRAWMALHRSRGFVPIGMGGPLSAPITWFDVEAYADRIRADANERQTLQQVISALDARFVKVERERRKAAEDARAP